MWKRLSHTPDNVTDSILRYAMNFLAPETVQYAEEDVIP